MYDADNDGGIQFYQQATRSTRTMPHINEMMPSKYLKGTDIEEDTLVTVAGIDQMDVGTEDKPQMKWVMMFKELEKPMVLNSTNIQLAAKICGSEDSDEWVGKRLVLYFDPSIMFKGEMKGGLRLRAAKVTKPAKPKLAAQAVADMDDDIPF
jgi:hypothetical protein